MTRARQVQQQMQLDLKIEAREILSLVKKADLHDRQAAQAKIEAGRRLCKVREAIPAQRGIAAKPWGDFVRSCSIDLETAKRWMQLSEYVDEQHGGVLPEGMSIMEVYRRLGLVPPNPHSVDKETPLPTHGKPGAPIPEKVALRLGLPETPPPKSAPPKSSPPPAVPDAPPPVEPPKVERLFKATLFPEDEPEITKGKGKADKPISPEERAAIVLAMIRDNVRRTPEADRTEVLARIERGLSEIAAKEGRATASPEAAMEASP